MPILDQDTPVGPTVAEGATRLRRKLLSIVDGIDSGLKDIRRLVNKHGRSNLVTEIGVGDAAEMVTVYDALKDILEITEVGRTIDDIPS